MAIQKYYDGANWINVNGLAPNILGSTDPTTATVGYLGQFYTNIITAKLYQCVAINGNSYTWLKLGGGTSSSDVTAAQAQVMSGYTTITSDSNDEIVGGTLPLSAVLSSHGGTINDYDGTVV